MANYRRAKLAVDAFRGFTSTTLTKPDPISRLFSTKPPSLPSNPPKLPGFSPPHSISHNPIPRIQINPLLAKRYYHVDRRQVQHFRRRGPHRWADWFKDPRRALVTIVVGGGVFITVYFGSIETVPYTKRRHFVILSSNMERQLGEKQFEEMKAGFKGKILPAIHPESVRVRMISNEIIDALKRGLRHDKGWSDIGYASEEFDPKFEGKGSEAMQMLMEGEEGKVEGKWSREDEILDDKWIESCRKKGQESGAKDATSHLVDLNWEVLVVDQPIVNAVCLPGGKIVVFTGLLKHFRSDAEIATIIGHEVGHAVARHSAEGITKNLWFGILSLILYQLISPDVVNPLSNLLLKLPFSRRMELEADHIGLLLIASAGYDPRVAPTVYAKLGKISGANSAMMDYLATHPSGNKRAELLARAHIMEEALAIYRDARAGRGAEGFL
ncbi:uncharacterized protein LOC126804136 [Argentina anserina]|uniref:uncharacterized protein LOC126804136 n=1 Tax=Argentina anserina TaxID=57926 RepID=UPI0021762826|nr:uncharacterized protein LOC126804136 [Potentilla anserina]